MLIRRQHGTMGILFSLFWPEFDVVEMVVKGQYWVFLVT
jgi:hypothetical protein